LLLLQIDSAGITVGAAYPQTAGATFAASQGYGLNLSGVNLGAATGSASEVDDIAEFTAGSNGTLTAGIIDENFPGATSPLFDLALSSGTYGTIDSLGRIGLSAVAGNNNVSTLNGGLTLTLYAVDGKTFPFIEMDGGQIATGVVVLQNSSASGAGIVSPSQMFTMPPLIHSHALRQKKN
jgi:hypothetical protein